MTRIEAVTLVIHCKPAPQPRVLTRSSVLLRSCSARYCQDSVETEKKRLTMCRNRFTLGDGGTEWRKLQ